MSMVTGGFVEYDPDRATYRLPPEHAASLTRSATPDNIAAFAQYIPLMGTVEDQVVACFKKGGGVPYSAYGRFHEVMAEDSGQTVVAALMDSILPLVPGLIDELKSGIDVLDDGTFLMQDIAASSQVHKNIDHPVGPLLYTLSCMHCMTVSLSENGAGLGTMWGEELARIMLNEAGFTKVEVEKLPHDFQNIYYNIKT
jgi:hypothetical protein